jgi:GTP-binding protein
VIVSEIEGTTRDSVDVRFQMGDQSFTAIDTAGVRKRKSVKDDVEFYSYHRSLRSIRRADVVALLIDATVPISQVDTQLGNEVLKHYKPTMVVINKWDLVESDHTQEEYLEYLDANLKGLNFAPVAFISARRGEGMQEVAAMAMNLYHQAGHRMGTGELNRLVERILAERGPISKGGKLAKLFYCTQLAVRPPTLGLFVNDPELIDANYERFLLNRLRDEVPFSEVPIKLVVRPRRHAPKQPG